MAQVHALRGHKERHSTSLQAQPTIPTRCGLCDYVVNECRADPLAAQIRRDTHRLHFSVCRVQLLECTTSCEPAVSPSCPECNLRLSEAIQIQRVLSSSEDFEIFLFRSSVQNVVARSQRKLASGASARLSDRTTRWCSMVPAINLPRPQNPRIFELDLKN